jgi:hypothetical protein
MLKTISIVGVGVGLALGLSACSTASMPDGTDVISDDGDDSIDTVDDSKVDPDPEPDPAIFAPIAGDWLTVVEEMLVDDCKMADWVSDGPGDSFLVNTPEEGRVDIEHGLGLERCTLTDTNFECDMWSLQDETARDEYGLNATITIDVMTSGVFPSEEEIEMNAQLRATCSGPDCWLVELTTASMPCMMELLIEAEAQ